jgi:hypothetical protein
VSEILLVFHGQARNAAGYRDDAIPLAQHLCMRVVAPLFDAARFPTWRYQRGGIVYGGAVEPIGNRTIGSHLSAHPAHDNPHQARPGPVAAVR